MEIAQQIWKSRVVIPVQYEVNCDFQCADFSETLFSSVFTDIACSRFYPNRKCIKYVQSFPNVRI